MYSLLLAVIYFSFISLGLPDSLLGSAWPVMHTELNASVSAAGLISMIISASTIVSSLVSERVTRRFKTGLVTAVSVMMTAAALFGFSFAKSLGMLYILAVPYGLGAGAVDSALNNFVAVHYSSRHMSWLHCCWGIGAAVSPYIMSACITSVGWRGGYRTVGIIQTVITVMLFVTLPVWKKKETGEEADDGKSEAVPYFAKFKIKGVIWALLTMFGYCAFEATAGLWASSFLVGTKGMSTVSAARCAALFYIGITVGRFLSGFAADRLGDRRMVRLGSYLAAAGAALILIPSESTVFAVIGLISAGIGGAPIFPSIIHSTPANFGEENSRGIIGIQMASAYVGMTFIPPLFGLIAEKAVAIYPVFLLVFIFVVMLSSIMLDRIPQREINQ